MRRVIATLALLSAGLVFAGFGAGLHRAADSLALLRPLAGMLTLSFAILYGRSWIGGLSLLAAGLAAATVIPPFLSRSAPGEVIVYSKNLWFANTQIEAVAADIEKAAPDIVLLQEVSAQNDALLLRLSQTWPHQHHCRFSAWSGIALLSRHPFTAPPRCSKTRAYALARVALPQGDTWVASVHLPWPWPIDSTHAEAEVARDFQGLDAPLLIGGDFNSFPWTARVAGLARATETRLAGPSLVTLNFRGLPLPIDHVLAPGGGSLERRRLLGGDHNGVLARVHLHVP